MARFEVVNALNLGQLGMSFDTVIDSGLFHVFDDDARPRYVTSLASVLKSGGGCYLMCFSDREPGDWGPRRVRQDELAAAFDDGWEITGIAADTFAINPVFGTSTAHAWLATIRAVTNPASASQRWQSLRRDIRSATAVQHADDRCGRSLSEERRYSSASAALRSGQESRSAWVLRGLAFPQVAASGRALSVETGARVCLRRVPLPSPAASPPRSVPR